MKKRVFGFTAIKFYLINDKRSILGVILLNLSLISIFLIQIYFPSFRINKIPEGLSVKEYESSLLFIVALATIVALIGEIYIIRNVIFKKILLDSEVSENRSDRFIYSSNQKDMIPLYQDKEMEIYQKGFTLKFLFYGLVLSGLFMIICVRLISLRPSTEEIFYQIAVISSLIYGLINFLFILRIKFER